MSNNNNESTMKYKIDIGELKSGLQQARREIRKANSEFKAAQSGMDNWKTSTEGLSSKLKQLDTVCSNQKKILSNLEEQYTLTAEEMGKDSKAAQDLEIRINNQKGEIAKTERQIRTYNDKLSELSIAQKQSESALGKLNNKINEQEQELSSLKREYQNYILSNEQGSSAAKELENKISSLSSELADNKNKLNASSSAADKLSGDLNDAGNDASEAKGGFTVLKVSISDLVSQGIDKAVAGFKELMVEEGRASANFQSATGANASEMKKYNKEMQELYKNNYGENLDNVADAMAKVKQQTQEVDPSKIKALAENGITLQDTFDMDFNETLRGATAMMKNMGVDGETAFNLIATGAQRGLNKSDELGDNLAEYSQLWGQAGFSAEEMFQILENGLNSGAYNLDKVNDFVKEFTISLADGRIEENLSNFSSNTKNMFTQWKDGKKTSRDVFMSVVNDLAKMENKQEALTIASNTWSALGEDNAMAVITSLNKVSGSYDNVQGKMEEIKKVKYGDVGNQLQELGRIIKIDVLSPIVSELTPAVTSIVNWVKSNTPAMISLIKLLGTTIATALSIKSLTLFHQGIINVGNGIGGLATKIPMLSGMLSSLGAFIVANPWLALATAIGAVTFAVIASGSAMDSETQKIHDAKTAIEEETNARNERLKVQQETAQKGVNEIGYYQSLKTELDGLISKNGKVKKGYEDRANFIMTTLNEALGTELSIIDGKIQGYDKEGKAIDLLISKKKAQIILESQEEGYKIAVQNKSKALQELQTAEDNYISVKTRNNEKIKQLESQLTEAQRYGNQSLASSLQGQISDLQNNTKQYEDIYNGKARVAKNYLSDIARYESDSAAIMSGNVDKIGEINNRIDTTITEGGKTVKKNAEQIWKDNLNQQKLYQQAYDETGDTMFLGLIEKAKKATADSKRELDATKATVDSKSAENKTAWDNYKKQGEEGYKGTSGIKTETKNKTDTAKSTVTENYEDFKKAWDTLDNYGLSGFKGTAQYNKQGAAKGNAANSGAAGKKGALSGTGAGLSSALLSGFSSGTGKLKTSGEKGGNQIKSGAESVKGAMPGVGSDYISGLNSGLNSNTGYLYTTITGIGNSMVSHLRKALDSHSPSRKTIKIGRDATKGLVLGVVRDMKSVINASKSLAKSVMKGFKSANGNYTKAGEKGISKVEKTINSIAEAAQAKYDEVIQKQESFRDRLDSYGDLFTQNSRGKVTLGNLQATTKQLKEYSANLEKLKKVAPAELMEEIAGMDVSQGAAFTAKLLSLSDKEMKQYFKDYTEMQNATRSISQKFYSNQLADIKKEFNDKVTAQMKSLNKQLTTIGQNAVNGLISGMKGKTKNLKSTAKSLANTIINQLKQSLKIKSPSKEAFSISDFFMQGLDNGIVGNIKIITGSIKRLGSDMVKTTREIMPDIGGIIQNANSGINVSASGINTVGSTGGDTYVFNQNNSSPKALSKVDIYMQTKSLLFAAKGGA
ncbi:phage tail tape measure protein [Anaerofustis stercorihominis]|uniref:phage tail tape measure protein n=1 Tax=Anaerofustis stercorihominis TaxID=214853 RepID=UPI0026741BF7|nr:phage tail tape measure protein [Anaerofustis stercorihominis]